MRARPLVLGLVAITFAACMESRDADNAASLSMQDAAAPQGADFSSSRGAVGGAVSTRASAPVGEEALAVPAAPPPPPGAEPPQSQPGQTTGSAQTIAPSMVIRTGDARVEVDSLEIALARLQALATQLGGFVGNTSIQTGERLVRQASVELKIPADRFSAAQAGLSSLGKVEFINVQAQEVGEEYVDITARMENARRLEQRLIALLAARTGRLEEVLSVERELSRVRELIERYEGRLRYLRTRAAVSTLTVTVHEKAPLVGELGSSNRIVEAFRNAWRNFVGFIALVIESLGVLVPIAVLAAAAVWIYSRLPRRPRPSRETPPRPAPPDNDTRP